VLLRKKNTVQDTVFSFSKQYNQCPGSSKHDPFTGFNSDSSGSRFNSSVPDRGFTMRLILAALILSLATSLTAHAQQSPLTNEQILERGRTLTDQFYRVDLEPVWKACSEDLKAALGGLDAFRSFRLEGVEAYGDELKLYEEDVIEQDDLKFYVRAASFVKRPDLVWFVIWGFDPATGVVEYFNIEFAGRVPG
jgi:hypothetical protein